MCYRPGMSQLRMIACTGCGTKAFIPSELPPLATVPCPKCGHKLMMPMQLRQFELRGLVGSGGIFCRMDQSTSTGVLRFLTLTSHG